MIDSKFIIRYTNGLYDTHPDNSPTYQEFRDMFSSGQIYSKEWVLRELANIDSIQHSKRIVIAGSWFGTLGMMIKSRFPSTQVTMLDIDPRCEIYVRNIIYNTPDMKCITEDMYEYCYKEDIIINTCCEHIADVREWLNIIPLDRTVVLQSNNYLTGRDHVNCVNSVDEFISQTNLKHIIYSGELVMPMYTRYMIIGKT